MLASTNKCPLTSLSNFNALTYMETRDGLGQKFSPGIFRPDQPTTLSADTT